MPTDSRKLTVRIHSGTRCPVWTPARLDTYIQEGAVPDTYRHVVSCPNAYCHEEACLDTYIREGAGPDTTSTMCPV